MRVIGHRGARGLAPENTLAAIKKGIESGADAIEFDVRLTKDKQLILLHDADLIRVASQRNLVSDLTYSEIKKLATKSREPIPRLEDVFSVSKSTPLLIEAKGYNWARPLVRTLKNHIGPPPAVISKNHEELFKFSCRRPDLETYAVTVTDPLAPIRSAKKHGLTGIDMNFWLMNPMVYILARQANLKIIIYTINSPFLLRILKFLYPQITAVTTDYPNRFQH